MSYVLNIEQGSNRILSAGIMLNHPIDACIVDRLPTGETDAEKDIHNWLYINGEYIYDPLSVPEQPESTPTDSERITALEDAITALIGGISDAV